MGRAGVLINPKAGRGNGKGVALAEKLSGANHVSVRLLEDFTRLTPYLYELANEDVSDLFISAGDGTIQAILTLLAEKPIFKSTPNICLLPHGTTNLTSIDLGFQHRNIAAQANFIKQLELKNLRTRPTLRILNARDGAIRHGMTIGIGAAAEGTRFTQQAFNDKGVHGSMAAFRTIGGSVTRSLFTKANPDDLTRLDRPYPIKIRYNGETLCEGPQLMLVATTLEKMFLKSNPFWGENNGPIRTSIFPYPVPNLVRWLLPIMYGGKNRKVPKGAISFSSKNFEIETTSLVVLDGEFFEPPQQSPLKIEAGPEFTFIRS
jgi:diacylglycerol kinase (ATP)